MKKVFITLALLLTLQITFGQTCEEISPYKEGTTMEYTNYNKKGKQKDVEQYKVTSVSSKSEDLVIQLEISVISKKNKSEPRATTLKCNNGDFFVNMGNYLMHQSENQESNLELKAEGDFLTFPSDLKAGTVLEDGNIALSVGEGESTFNLANMTVSNRKVLEVGSITTAAGTFDGYKMSFDYLFDMGLLKIRGGGVEWYVKGIGIVKTESYNKKGKLRWYRELTKISWE